MENIVKSKSLPEELEELERIIPAESIDITIDNIINKFSNQSSATDVMIGFMEDLELEFDLACLEYYGYKNYSVPTHLYQIGDPLLCVVEKLRVLRKAAAIIRLQDDIENNNVVLPLKSENGKYYGSIRNNEDGELVLDVFNNDRVQQVSIIVHNKKLLEDNSYEPQSVVIRYSGDFAGESGMFYEIVEDLALLSQISSLSISAYDEYSVLSPEMYDFSYMLPGKPIDEKVINICQISNEKKDLGKLSLGLHPDKISEICGEENPIGSARRKKGTLQQ